MSTAPSTVPLAELNFYRTERPRLIADGITDYNAQCAELKRRWDVLQAIKAAAPPPAPALAVGEVALDAPLGADDISAMSLELNRVDTSGPTVKYIYVQVQDLDPPTTKPAAESKKRAAEAPTEAGPSKTPRAQHPLALVGKLLQQLKKNTLQNICDDLKEPVSGNKEELIIRIADAM
jgi:hypothetical protein